jgi:GNAT superfamily N-acetyltransferase
MRDISIRAAEAADSEFAYRVLERTMREVAVAAWGKWSEAEGRERTASDARAGRSQIIQWGSEPVGLLCVDKLDTHTQLDQLYVLPDYQRRGIGAKVLQLILSEARSAKRPVRGYSGQIQRRISTRGTGSRSSRKRPSGCSWSTLHRESTTRSHVRSNNDTATRSLLRLDVLAVSAVAIASFNCGDNADAPTPVESARRPTALF